MGGMDGIEHSSEASHLQQSQKMLESEQWRRQQAEQQVAQQAEAIATLQNQLRTMQSAFENLRQQNATAKEARVAAEQQVAHQQQRQAEQVQENLLRERRIAEQVSRDAANHTVRIAADHVVGAEMRHEACEAGDQGILTVRNRLLTPVRSSTGGTTSSNNSEASAQQLDDVLMRRLALNVTIDTLPKYSATSNTQTIQKWISRVDEDAEVNGWNEYEKLLAAKRALTGAAQRRFDGRKGVKSWNALRQGLLGTFGRQIKSSDVHERLCNRKRQKGEAMIDYVHEMEYLSSQADLAVDLTSQEKVPREAARRVRRSPMISSSRSDHTSSETRVTIGQSTKIQTSGITSVAK